VAASGGGRIGLVNLLDRRVVGVGVEGIFDGAEIGVVAIGRQLNAVTGDASRSWRP
jgi:hypothetical protein